MSGNQKLLLDAIIEQRRKAQESALSEADYFELFTSESILKQEALSYDELESGLVGSGGDGGIDAAYFLIDGRLIREDTDFEEFRKKPSFEIYFIQAKRSDGFGESAIDKFISITDNLFDFSKNIGDFSSLYNSDIRGLFSNFRQLYINLAGKHPQVKVTYYYATKGNVAEIHPNVRSRVPELEVALSRHFSDAEFVFEFAGAAELLSLARKRPPESLMLPVSEVLTADTGGYVALTKISDYNKFLRNSDGKPYGHIFDENVRAYQGSVEVNKGIKDTLRADTSEDFWWLNNGITILAQKASQTGKTIVITDPQVINGLQTSTEILSYFNDNPGATDARHVMIKIVESTSPATRDRVTKATNSQTGIQPASLRATDPIQRDIEEALSKAGLYYDRQKNFYKNEGRPLSRIIGIAEMAQTVMSMLLQRPNDARARPSSLIKDDADYGKIFSETLPIQLYVVAGEAKKRCDEYLRTTHLDSADRNNLLYYVLTRLSVLITRKQTPQAEDIAVIKVSDVAGNSIASALADVEPLYRSLGGGERVAKGAELVSLVKALELPAS